MRKYTQYLLLHCSLIPCLFIVVSCQQHGDLRLAGYGANNLAGRLEIYYDGQWGTICGGIKFNLLTASVACRQLGLGPAISFTYYPDLRQWMNEWTDGIAIEWMDGWING